MKKSEMTKALTALFLQYPGAEAAQPVVELWHAALGRFSAEEFNRAVLDVLVTYTGTFPPTIAMVAQAIAKRKSLQQELTDGESWRVLIEAVRRFGIYRGTEASHYLQAKSDLVYRAVKALGWENVCKWDTADEVANRAQFWKIINGYKKADETSTIFIREINPAVIGSSKREISHGN